MAGEPCVHILVLGTTVIPLSDRHVVYSQNRMLLLSWGIAVALRFLKPFTHADKAERP